jgi:hypothetical protein
VETAFWVSKAWIDTPHVSLEEKILSFGFVPVNERSNKNMLNLGVCVAALKAKVSLRILHYLAYIEGKTKA